MNPLAALRGTAKRQRRKRAWHIATALWRSGIARDADQARKFADELTAAGRRERQRDRERRRAYGRGT